MHWRRFGGEVIFRQTGRKTMTKRVATLLLILLLGIPSVVRADDDASQVIRTFCDELLAVMKNAEQLGYNGRVQRLGPAVDSAYDMPAMTRAMLGVAASKLSPDEEKSIDDAFTRFSVATYAQQFDGWDGEKFEVSPSHPSTGGSVVVPSRIVQKDGSTTEIDYVMHRADSGRWTIVDVLLEGTISQVAVRRSEFISIFRGSGAAGLVELLNKKTVALGKT
jgi:phospholipid transport system substrate-binding protein